MNVHLYRSVRDSTVWSKHALYDTHRWWLDVAKYSIEHCITSLSAADMVIVTDTELGKIVYGDSYKKMLRKSLRGKVFVVYDQSDVPIINLKGLYTSLASYQTVNRYVAQVPYVSTYTKIQVQTENWHQTRNVLWAFSGGCGQPGFMGYKVRQNILAISDEEAIVRDTTFDSMWSMNGDATMLRRRNQSLMKHELEKAVFCICPCGAGVSSFRMYEAMRSGCIPVIVSDHWVPSLPIDWNQFSIRIREDQVHEIPRLLREKSKHASQLRENLRAVVETYLADQVIFDYQVHVGLSISNNLDFVPTSATNLLTKVRRRLQKFSR
jgi:hypothetical protein